MLEASWMWVRTLGSLCVLGCMLSVACSDSEGNGVTGGSGGGGAGGPSGAGGEGQGGSGNGGSSNGGTGDGGTGLCPTSVAELCTDLPEGCPERLQTWLTCGARGEITPRAGVGEPRRFQCDDHVVIVRVANGYGFRRWYYDASGVLVGVENVEDIGGPRCGELVPSACRRSDEGEPLRRDAPDAGNDAGAIDDAGVINDAGLAAATDAGGDGGASELDCSRL
jgi:hypothetical protein